MTIALKTRGGEVLNFDAITSLSYSSSGSVTKHAIESGVNISDHIVNDNMSVSFSGFLSPTSFVGTDFRQIADSIDKTDPDYYTSTYANEPSYEVNVQSYNSVSEVTFDSNDESLLSRVLPETISSVLSNNLPPKPIVAERSSSFNPQPGIAGDSAVGARGVEAMYDYLLTWQRGSSYKSVTGTTSGDLVGREILDILVLDRTNGSVVVANILKGYVITNISRNEDISSGDGLYVTMSLEKPEYALLKSTKVNKVSASEYATATSEKKSKGVVSSGKNGSNGDKNNADKSAKEAMDKCVRVNIYGQTEVETTFACMVTGAAEGAAEFFNGD